MQEEQWRDVPGYEGLYQVSNQGRVKSAQRRGAYRRFLKLSVHDTYGYLGVNLHKDGKLKWWYINRLVWFAFCGPIPDKHDVHHKDQDNKNNCLDNFELVPSGFHRQRHKMGELNPNAKLTDAQTLEIQQRVLAGEQRTKVAQEYMVSRATITRVCSGLAA
jgi:hypothetical protein